MRYLTLLTLITILLISIAIVSLAGGEEVKEFSIFLGKPFQSYPETTMLGDIISEETGVKLKREYLVGDLEVKIALMIASGEYPDMVQARHFTSRLIDNDVLIPLNDLIEEHAPNIKRLYSKYWKMLKQKDGNIYCLPPNCIPYQEYAKKYPDLGFFIQKDILKEAGYPYVKTLDQYFRLIEGYMKKHPTINGKKTIGYLTLFDGWRIFATTTAPANLMGYANEGAYTVVEERGKYVVKPFYTSKATRYYYRKLNEMYHKGVLGRESFVMSYNQYLEKISSGQVLGTYNQIWQIGDAMDILRKEQPERILIPFPVVKEELIEEHYLGGEDMRTVQGLGITTACDDPIKAIKYLDYLVKEETQFLINWGFEGEHYLVDENGIFHQTEKRKRQFNDRDWVVNQFGRPYFRDLLPSLSGMNKDGNPFRQGKRKDLTYKNSTKSEKEVLDAYGIKSFTELYNKPYGDERKYYPLWTIPLPTGSLADINQKKIDDQQIRFVPKLVMCNPEEFDGIWNEYVDNISALMVEPIKYYQKQVDWRMENW